MGSVAARVRRGLLVVLVLMGIGYFGSRLHAHYSIADWLVWDLAKLWGYVAVFSAACVCAGARVLTSVLRVSGRNALESVLFAMALGLVVFVLCMYALGALAGFRPVFAVFLTLGLVLSGLGPGVELMARSLVEPFAQKSSSPAGRLITLWGAACLLLLYLGSMTPDSLNYDATWFHVVIAQDYARAGRIVPFVADYNRAVPHLASMLYTWCYLVPGLSLPLRWMLVLHCEFGLFLWTLVGVAAGVRWVVDRPKLGAAWSAVFLFPMLFVYDSNLGGAADHVLAFFCAPLLLVAREAARELRPAWCIAFAVLSGAALLTKYQAFYIVLPFVPVLAWRWSVLVSSAWRGRGGPLERRGRWLLTLTPVLTGVVTLLVFTPHLLKNYVFYHNPLYPFLLEYFPASSPTTPNAALFFDNIFKDKRWVPAGGPFEVLVHGLELFFTFSFEPHYTFGRALPLFGSLFTLLLPALPFVRSRRLYFVAFVASAALFTWAVVFNVDRNLQTFLPYLAIVTGSLLALLWRQGTLLRFGLAGLVGLQVAWGALAISFGSYARINSALLLLKSGLEGQSAAQYASYRAVYRSLARVLPPDARVLLHAHHQSLGIDRDVLVDWTGHQGLVSYERVRSVAGLARYYRSLGVSHVLYVPLERAAPSLQEELVFAVFAGSAAVEPARFPPYVLLRVPDAAARVSGRHLRALTLGMPGYADGLYDAEQLGVLEALPAPLRHYPEPKQHARNDAERLALFAQADAVFMGATAGQSAPLRAELRQFGRVLDYSGQFRLYLRSGGR